jgi:hypothetical protein
MNNTTATMNTISNKEIKDFAIQYLGLEFDEEKNEFYAILGQYASPELVGTRRIYSEETILKKMNDCSVNY